MPVLHGSVTLSAAATATAASAALPPRLSTCRPISAARGWLHATQPWRQSTGDRRDVNGRAICLWVGWGAEWTIFIDTCDWLTSTLRGTWIREWESERKHGTWYLWTWGFDIRKCDSWLPRGKKHKMEAGVRIFSLCRSIHHWYPLLTASRTLATIQPSLRSFPLKQQHRHVSQESAADDEEFERNEPYFSKSREDYDHQAFPSAKGPLNNQTWRQLLTSDKKTIVCVHPAKPVPIQDTKVQYYCKFMLKSLFCGNLLPVEWDLQTDLCFFPLLLLKI